jgi:transcriptional regulator with XRE-family HTH domain
VAPFGETVLAWRLERGLTQAQLARAAAMPRSNLSAVERGDREVTLRTLRALALALEVRPGVLADGVLPGGDSAPLSRNALERVARSAARRQDPADPAEARLVRHLRGALSPSSEGRRSGRRADRAYLLLRGGAESATLATLVERVREKLLR